MKLEELLGKRLVFVDGGMGTMLQAAGLTGGEAPERWNLTHPETVAEVHRAYLAAGRHCHGEHLWGHGSPLRGGAAKSDPGGGEAGAPGSGGSGARLCCL